MIKRSTFLASSVLLRQEDNFVYLFNKKNSAVLKMLQSEYRKLTSGQNLDAATLNNMVAILAQYEMLAEQSVTSEAKKATQENHGRYPTIFGLQSTSNPFTVLWAITACCNLSCSYCFPAATRVNPNVASLPYVELQRIVTQITQAQVLQVTLSGGEALLTKNIWAIISSLFSSKAKLVVITNGTNINTAIASNLKQFEIIAAVSLDAMNETVNAKTRGSGVFAQTLRGIKTLQSQQVPIVILITVTRINFAYLLEHVKFIYAELKIRNITLQDLRPFGTKEAYNHLRLTLDQELQLPQVLQTLKTTFSEINFNFTELAIFPILETKTIKTGKIMQCPAGYNMAYIDFFGDMYPCTHLPTMKLGNVLRDGTITDLWRSSPTMQNLRELKNKHISHLENCNGCSLQIYCDGGCRGDAIFYHNNLYGLASRCPREMQY